MLTFEELDRQMEGDVSPAGLLYMTVGLAVGCGLMLGGLIGAMIGHFVLEPDYGMANGTIIGSLVGAVVISTLAYLGLRAASMHLMTTDH